MAPRLSMRLPSLINAVVDREAPAGILLLEDLVDRGAHFCGALEPYSLDDAAASLEQIARLHTAPPEVAGVPWARSWMLRIIGQGAVQQAELEKLMQDPRGDSLPAQTKDASAIIDAARRLAIESERGPQTLLHGDTHAGNIFMTNEGPGLNDWQNYQRGLWAADVAYHIAAVLPVEVAEREERRLLDHYLDCVRRFRGNAPDRDGAWKAYRMSPVWGFYLWAITRFVEPPIIYEFVKRLGASVTRHESFALLRDTL
jgi:aminoglycoside phosphotransferase (APT) family kinase protein